MRVSRAAVLPFALLLLLSACSKTLDVDFIEEQVRAGIEEETSVPVTVDCPAGDIPVEEGGSFPCVATDEGGGSLPVEIQQRNDEGDVTWNLLAVDIGNVEGKIGQGLSKDLGAAVEVSCPKQLILISVRTTLPCDATDGGGGRGRVKAILGGSAEDLAWKLAKPNTLGGG